LKTNAREGAVKKSAEDVTKKGGADATVLDYATLVEQLAAQQRVPSRKVRAIVSGLTALAAAGLKDGKVVRIGGFGSLQVRDRKAAAAGESGEAARSAVGKRVVLSFSKKFKAASDVE
jgi:nucleoid DNA-binding protein